MVDQDCSSQTSCLVVLPSALSRLCGLQHSSTACCDLCALLQAAAHALHCLQRRRFVTSSTPEASGASGGPQAPPPPPAATGASTPEAWGASGGLASVASIACSRKRIDAPSFGRIWGGASAASTKRFQPVSSAKQYQSRITMPNRSSVGSTYHILGASGARGRGCLVEGPLHLRTALD